MRLDIPEVISASVSGAIKFMDVRTMRTYKTIEVHKSPLTACAVHNFCPIIATGSHAQFIKLLSLAGEQLGMIRYCISLSLYKVLICCLLLYDQVP